MIKENELKKGTCILTSFGYVGFVCDNAYSKDYPYKIIWEGGFGSYSLEFINLHGYEIISKEKYKSILEKQNKML